jgi:hypothetical protein
VRIAVNTATAVGWAFLLGGGVMWWRARRGRAADVTYDQPDTDGGEAVQ